MTHMPHRKLKLKDEQAKDNIDQPIVMCSCDGCGKQYQEPNPSYVFGEFNVCPECKKRTDLKWE